MSEFLPKEIGGFAGITVLTLFPPTSHASLPEGEGVSLVPGNFHAQEELGRG